MDRFSLDASSASYKDTREALRQAEIALIEQREKVAELRRSLPADTPVSEEYAFAEAVAGDTRTVKLSELFDPGAESLLVAHYMWAEADENPCPMCTMWTDGYNAVHPHVSRRTSFVAVAKKDPATFRKLADSRGWTNLRTLSSAGTTFNRDFGMEDEKGNQFPGISAFKKMKDGSIRHFYTVSAMMGGDHYRGMDLLSPVWNLFDLLPEGRGDWFPSVSYKNA